jgi:hypothetical protein
MVVARLKLIPEISQNNALLAENGDYFRRSKEV